MFRFTEKNRVRSVAAPAASAGTAVTSSFVKVDGRSVVFMASIGTNNAGNFMTLQYSSDGTNSLGDIEGSKTLFPAADKPAVAEVERPIYPYVRATITRAGANTTTSNIISIVHDALDQPVVATLANENLTNANNLLSPPLGTA